MKNYFLKKYSWFCLFNMTLIPTSVSSQPDEKPNVLFILCDDLNDYVGCYHSNPDAITPNIDKLAEKGIQFSCAHANAAWCAPSRTSLLSGFYPSTTLTYNGQSIRQTRVFKNVKNIMQHFTDNGYNTYGTGKVFHNTKEHEENVWTEYGQPADYGPYPQKGNKRLVHPDMPEKYVELTPGLKEFSIAPLSHIPEGNGYDGWYIGGSLFKYRDRKNRDAMPDEKSAEFAVDVLGRDYQKPFFLAVGMIRPHAPYYLPDEFFEMFNPDSLTLPLILKNDLEDCAPELAKLDPNREVRQLKHIIDGFGGEIGWRKFLQAYLASVAFTDAQVGKVLKALENSKYAKNTIIVLTSDQGYHTGQKNLWFKGTPWERTTRIPLLVSIPGLQNAGKICRKPVSLIDLYPTLIDLCHLPKNPNGMNGPQLEGHSMVPFLLDPLYGKWEGPDVAFTSLTQGADDKFYYAVRSDRYRYIYTYNHEEELYDHQTDSEEWHNQANNPEYLTIKNQMRSKLFQLAFNKK